VLGKWETNDNGTATTDDHVDGSVILLGVGVGVDGGLGATNEI
jgi:hypothetical protein